jgi:putative tryptophan/tyrosine transport system substrate-binding protein
MEALAAEFPFAWGCSSHSIDAPPSRSMRSADEGAGHRVVPGATAAQAVQQRLFVVEIEADRDLEPAFASAVEQKAGALFIGTGAYLGGRLRLLAALALRHRLPASHGQREFVVAGGLMSYGTSFTDAYRQGGVYAGRVLKGELPADLPVLQATKFDFVINLATAKALGLAVPMHIHAAADEVIE